MEWSVKCPVVLESFVTPWTAALQAPLSMAFSRQEYWSGLPFPSAGDLPNPGIELRSPALWADSLLTEPPGKPWFQLIPAVSVTVPYKLPMHYLKSLHMYPKQCVIGIGFSVVLYMWRRLSTEELMLLKIWCFGVGEDSWESLGLQGDPTSPF